MRLHRLIQAALAAALLAHTAAAEPLPGKDLGVLENEEVKVVQENLYEKAGHLEIGAGVGLIPSDPWYRAGTFGLSGTYHLSEALGLELSGHFALGRPTRQAETLADFGGAAVDGYAPRALVSVDALWTPIYAKLNLLGQVVLHYDIYLSGGAGIYLARRSLLEGVDASGEDPAGGSWNSPASLNLGLGHRFFYRAGSRAQSIRVDLRDHIFLAEDPGGDRWPKHNLHLSAGWGIFF